MKYETAEAFRTALEQRLKNEAEASGVALMRLRKRVAFERFLARLTAAEPGGWVLKGAFALELRLGLRTRTTKDIDLGRADDEEAATEHLNAATGVDLGDFFGFEARRTPPPPRSWARPYAELAREVGIEADMDVGHAAAADLLDPVLGADAGGRWDPNARLWRH